MKLAVLPFNAAEGTAPALGRQFSQFVYETVRNSTEADINLVSLLAQVGNEGEQRAAFVNISNDLLEYQWIQQLFEGSDVDKVMDGMLVQNNGGFDLKVRIHERGKEEPLVQRELTFKKEEVFGTLHDLVKELASQAQVDLPQELATEIDYGTEDPEAFLKFLEGHDAASYIQQTNGQVAQEFSPEPALNTLLEAIEKDPDFLGPYEVLLHLSRMCSQYRIGTFEMIEQALKKAQELAPEDYRAFAVLGEVYGGVGAHGPAADMFEKSLQMEQDEAWLYSRLGMAQMYLGMPVNAERNFRKAIEMEDEEKPTLDLLAAVLQQTGRAHEVPAMRKEVLEKNPQNPHLHVKYAAALMDAGRQDEAIAAFEEATETLEDPIVVKRFYAPLLVQREEFDRAMDYYEDCIDQAPNDIPVLLEYAQTLQQAGREFEVPKVLRDVLASNPDPNTLAQTTAWLIELEQPKRVEQVEAARAKMEEGDFESAIRQLKPLRNWLADYWKLWALLSSAHNRLDEGKEAEEAAVRLLNMFPGCEPAYGELVAALGQQGRHDEAYNIMRNVASNMPGSLPIHLNLALAAKRAGHEDEARQIAEQIRAAVGDNEQIAPILAEIEA
jgi:tetratricopeptide (TPR) repeat protein